MNNSGPPERRVGLGRGSGPARHTPLNPGKGLQPGGKPLGRRTELRSKMPAARPAPTERPTPQSSSQRSRSTDVPTRVRKFVYRRDEERCARCGIELRDGNRQLQHRAPRGSGGAGRKVDPHRLSNLVSLCGALSTDPSGCHYWAESQVNDAREAGYRVAMGVDPETVPVLWHDGERYFLCDDGDRYALVDTDLPP